jgi:hypothetical protein
MNNGRDECQNGPVPPVRQGSRPRIGSKRGYAEHAAADCFVIRLLVRFIRMIPVMRVAALNGAGMIVACFVLYVRKAMDGGRRGSEGDRDRRRREGSHGQCGKHRADSGGDSFVKAA